MTKDFVFEIMLYENLFLVIKTPIKGGFTESGVDHAIVNPQGSFKVPEVTMTVKRGYKNRYALSKSKFDVFNIIFNFC